jgi:hypothetical protein
MATERFRDWQPSADTRALLETCRAIIGELYKYKLTLRQLYYQLVSRGIIPNREREYRSLSRVLTRARLAGLLDWGAIEDRMRPPDRPFEFDGLADLVDVALESYRLPRWAGQATYAELWVEKDALSSVLRPIASEYHVTMMVNRGYGSTSSMYDSARRFAAAEDDGRTLHLFYLGDLDPSGEDMVRDIRQRFAEFRVGVQVEKIALSPEQVDTYNPPPNPAKLTDPRAGAFVAKHGASSWEVDALPPDVLARLIRDAIEGVLDVPTMEAVKVREAADRTRLRAAVSGLGG